MKIKEQYSNKIVELTNNIDSYVKKLGFVVYNLNLLKKEKENFIEEIKKLNQEKDALIQEIYNEYGNGYIDPNTWQFSSTQEQQSYKSEQQSAIQEN